jgi:hypothetical protein
MGEPEQVGFLYRALNAGHGHWFVALVVRDGREIEQVAGPFPTKAKATAAVAETVYLMRQAGCKASAWKAPRKEMDR